MRRQGEESENDEIKSLRRENLIVSVKLTRRENTEKRNEKKNILISVKLRKDMRK